MSDLLVVLDKMLQPLGTTEANMTASQGSAVCGKKKNHIKGLQYGSRLLRVCKQGIKML